jgi:hypothetical protein
MRLIPVCINEAMKRDDYQKMKQLYLKLRETETNESKWRTICGKRLPVSFFDNVNKFNSLPPFALWCDWIRRISKLFEYYLIKVIKRYEKGFYIFCTLQFGVRSMVI